ncbi:hypothetical protein FV222_00345 [Methylobacterium sp. WL103]|uniref:hypothetical protein n=1 Tax=Methylobacterium sp. WL103 TaxID=2603891 RepID=UPI0011CA4155|nr:hypothetical protein [Methylobacterium sp. WL103]TXN08954.1 hypothetical protein FV222_00345 [Methylobacterium sp. WL103]
MNKLQVSGAIVSKNGVTLFTPAGESKVFGADSWKTAAILDAVLVPLAKSEGEPVEIDLDQFSLAKRIEQATNGALKVEEKVENGVSKIAIETASGARIEDASLLEKHIGEVAVTGSVGLGRFIERFARLDHKHTADELLKFVQKMDLPIADDGCIVVYKFLTKQGDDRFVDSHTRKIVQRLGSRVSMPLDKVNMSRAQCASGLHVCSATYGQYGDAIFLAKVDPADVVAIPENYSGGKMRCTAYHLVALLDGAAHSAVSAKKSALTANGATGIVANVIAGNHPAILEEVVVGGSFVQNTETKVTTTVVSQPQAAPALNPVRPIAAVAKIDPKDVKDRLHAALNPTPQFEIGQQVDMEGTPVFVREIEGRKALVATRLKHGHGTWVSLTRLAALQVAAPVETPAPAPVVEAPSPAPVEQKAPEPTGTEAWAVAKPGDTVRIEGSSKIPDGDYVVDRVSNDGRASRCRVKCEAFGSLGVANTLVKAIVAAKGNPPLVMKVEPVAKVAKRIEKVAESVKAVADGTFDKATIYANKLVQATKLHQAGKSLREIEKELRMCRKALAKHLKAA